MAGTTSTAGRKGAAEETRIRDVLGLLGQQRKGIKAGSGQQHWRGCFGAAKGWVDGWVKTGCLGNERDCCLGGS